MGATAGILQGVSTGGTAASQYIQAGAVTKQAQFGTDVAAMNAADAVTRGNYMAGRREQAGRSVIGAQRAAASASGVDANTGSAADLQTNEARFSALDAMTIRNNAAREAWGYQSQAALGHLASQNEANALRAESYNTLLTGAVKTYGIYQANKNTKTPTTAPVAPAGTRVDARPYFG